MISPATLADETTVPYGFGLGLESFEGRPMIAHGGGINGFLSWLAYFPDQRVSVAVVINAESPAAQDLLATGVARAALGLPDLGAQADRDPYCRIVRQLALSGPDFVGDDMPPEEIKQFIGTTILPRLKEARRHAPQEVEADLDILIEVYEQEAATGAFARANEDFQAARERVFLFDQERCDLF